MPIFFSNFRQMWNISSIVCGTSNCSVDPRIKYVYNGDAEMLVNISISSKNREEKCTECVVIKGLNS